jgi:hypothetical protein
MKIPRIGRGKNMSIAKAGLVVWMVMQKGDDYPPPFFYSGELTPMHDIVDVAGAKHVSFHTTHQVLGCLNGSPYWRVRGTIPGWQERRAYTYAPSAKGFEWLEKHRMEYADTILHSQNNEPGNW